MDTVLQGLVKYPTLEQAEVADWLAQRLCVVAIDTPGHVWIPLETKRNRFERCPDSIAAIEAFCIAHQNGYFPPYWAIEHLAAAFAKWHDAQGTKSLDRFLKLSPKRFKALFQDQRDELVMRDVAILVSLGLSAAQASTFAAKRLVSSGWNKTKYKNLGSITSTTVLDRWKRRWSKTFTQEFVTKYLAPKSEAARADFLKQFPGALKAATVNRATGKVVVRKKKNGTT